MDKTVLIINDIVVLLLSLFLTFLKSYFKEKGKNLATREDIENITKKIESVKSMYEKEHINLQKELDSKIEIMKAKLKTTEIYFQKQLESLENFLKLYNEIYPKYDHPHKDLENAYIEILNKLDNIDISIEKFLFKYEIYIPNEATNLLEKITYICIDGQIEEQYKYSIAEEILDLLNNSKKIMVNEIKNNILF
jgi:hypothetical protein